MADLAAAARTRGNQPRAHIKPRRRDEAPNPKAVVNLTDPDSRFLHTRNGTVQGYNAQAVVTEHQVVIAAALTRQASAPTASARRRHQHRPPMATGSPWRVRARQPGRPDPPSGQPQATDPIGRGG